VSDTIPASKRGSCATCGKAVWRSKSSAEVQSCRDCRKAVLTHGASAYRKGCRCQVCRNEVASKQREYSARLKSESRTRSRGGVPSRCLHCGGDFIARRDNVASGGGKHCSIRCANFTKAAARGCRRTPPRKSDFRRRTERVAERASRGSTGGNLIWVQGPCLVCRTQFMSRGAMSRYCSQSCRDRNRQRAFGITWLDRMALFDRDDWKCQICLEAVDYSADPLSDWYPTLDHIVPRSKGGSHDYKNLRTAHRWCNSVRGDLSHYSDRQLSELLA